MTHITFINKTRSKPSLEFYSDGGSEARRVVIEKSPFRIGRAESADLRIDSVQVSREHAEILDRGGVWFVRDLGSTNGTQVNGKKVSETLLADGDILKVAETELTFIASPTSQFQRMVTQPIHARDARQTTSPSIPSELAATRALIEATLWQAIPTRLFLAVSLHHQTSEAIFTNVAAGSFAGDLRSVARSPHAAAMRYRELERLRAIEAAQESGRAERIFVAIDAAEIENQELFDELEQLQDLLAVENELGITVPMSAVLDSARADEFHRAVHARGLLLAYDDFQGNGGQVAQFEAYAPDYLLLSESMTKGLLDTRQPMRRLESVWSACEEHAVKPVLPYCECPQTLAQCRQAGYHLALEPTSSASKRGAIPSLVST